MKSVYYSANLYNPKLRGNISTSMYRISSGIYPLCFLMKKKSKLLFIDTYFMIISSKNAIQLSTNKSNIKLVDVSA